MPGPNRVTLRSSTQKNGGAADRPPRSGRETLLVALLVEPATKAVFHPAGERTATALGFLGPGSTGSGSRFVLAHHARAGDGEDHATEHRDEADHADDQDQMVLAVEGDTGHQHRQA